eukprot:COSAG05_NODE_17173_length_330_cov_0.891775_1_plen_20_part_10
MELQLADSLGDAVGAAGVGA